MRWVLLGIVCCMLILAVRSCSPAPKTEKSSTEKQLSSARQAAESARTAAAEAKRKVQVAAKAASDSRQAASAVAREVKGGGSGNVSALAASARAAAESAATAGAGARESAREASQCAATARQARNDASHPETGAPSRAAAEELEKIAASAEQAAQNANAAAEEAEEHARAAKASSDEAAVLRAANTPDDAGHQAHGDKGDGSSGAGIPSGDSQGGAKRTAVPGELPEFPSLPPVTTSAPRGSLPAPKKKAEAVKIVGQWKQIAGDNGADFLPGGYAGSLFTFRDDDILEVCRTFGESEEISQTWRVGYRWSQDGAVLTIGADQTSRPSTDSLAGFVFQANNVRITPAAQAFPAILRRAALPKGQIRLGDKAYEQMADK